MQFVDLLLFVAPAHVKMHNVANDRFIALAHLKVSKSVNTFRDLLCFKHLYMF